MLTIQLPLSRPELTRANGPPTSEGSGDRLHLALLILLHESLMTIELHGPREAKKTWWNTGRTQGGRRNKTSEIWVNIGDSNLGLKVW